MCSLEAERRQLQRYTIADGTVLWKDAFAERYRLWCNWHAGRCVIRTFEGHTQDFDTEFCMSSEEKWSLRYGICCTPLPVLEILVIDTCKWDIPELRNVCRGNGLSGLVLGCSRTQDIAARKECLIVKELMHIGAAASPVARSLSVIVAFWQVWDLAVNTTWSSIACRRTMVGHTNFVRCLQVCLQVYWPHSLS
uniref:Uncharacterized protein n=1 Tax=Parascaris equorum TaxID=6256 RepID=A0A914RIH8_PAREQ